MKIQSKITAFLLLIVLVFILFAFFQFQSQNKSFSTLLQDTKKQQIALFDKLLDVEGKNTEVFVRDYTFWDEMVDFISSKDKAFAEENIDTGAETFDADVVKVYDTKRALIYEMEGEGVLFPPQVFDQLDKDRFVHFFVAVGDKVIEIRGATVHPTDDALRLTAPEGYFFAGRVLDEDYIGVLADIAKSSVSILSTSSKALSDRNNLNAVDSKMGYVSYIRDLPGWDGNSVGYLYVEKTFFGISQFYAALTKQFWTFGIFLFALILFVFFFLEKFVTRPLRILSRSIRDQNTKPIEGMREEKSEFGDLADVVIRFSEKIDVAKTEFVSLVSHQLRTPLTIVGWYIERLEKLLKKEAITNPKGDEYVKGISLANKRMVELVNATVEISRIESGHLNLRLTEVDLAHIVDEVVHELAPALEKNQISFEKKYDADLPHPILDERLVFIIIENLLSNAVKYTEEGGRISLKISKEVGGVGIAITDTGIGISSEDTDKIFKKLFRTEIAREKDPEGSGLGLYIAKALAVTLGGDIELTSVLGEGTTFLVNLPLFTPKKGNT